MSLKARLSAICHEWPNTLTMEQMRANLPFLNSVRVSEADYRRGLGMSVLTDISGYHHLVPQRGHFDPHRQTSFSDGRCGALGMNLGRRRLLAATR